MADFNEVRQSLRAIQKNVGAKQQGIFYQRERLKKLDLAKKQVGRVHSANSRQFQQLVRTEQSIRANIQSQKADLGKLLQEHNRWILEFEPFADPRINIGQFDDHTPILLFPVRLETRFKIVTTDNGQQHQLWVRIFPDECSIDAFDETLSDAEIEKARAYWSEIWQAGKPSDASLETYVKDKHRGAWKKLMGIFNAGRSFF